MSVRRFAAAFSSLALLAGLLFSGGCASQPPNQSTLSGKRLIVDMTFAGAVDPTQHYFFLINVSNDQNAKGPIPVLDTPYGNGIATGPAGVIGYTDFVEYDSMQPNGYDLYHVIGDPVNRRYQSEGAPVSYILPDPNPDNTGSTRLHFEIDLSQLIVDANGKPLASQTTTVSQARSLTWIQCNIVTTNIIPTDPNTHVPNRLTDSIGDNSTPGSPGNSNWLTIDLSQLRAYHNGDSTLTLVEPPDYDVFGGGSDTPIDLRDWTITVQQQ